MNRDDQQPMARRSLLAGAGTAGAVVAAAALLIALASQLIYIKKYIKKSLPRTADEMVKLCDKLSSSKVEEGDMVFFKIESKQVTHVGVYLKNNKFIHASTKKGVMISDLNEPYFKKYFYTFGRLK